MEEPSFRVDADFFVSRAGANKAVAREVADALRAAGYAVRYQDEDIPVGTNFVEAMHELLKHCRHLIVLLSPAYAASPYCQQEWTNFLASSTREGFARRFIVLRVEDCVPDGMFSAIVYANLAGVADAEERKRIILAAAEGRAQDTPRTPPIFSGVPERTTNFAGRAKLLEELRVTLLKEDGKPAAIAQTQAIKGLGGVGKTFLAAEYAHVHKSFYAGVWWAPADRRETLISSLAVLGSRLDRKLSDVSDHEAVAQQVLGLISRSVLPWLLIYDNVENPNSIHGLLPASGAHVLLTTRWSDWGGQARELSVDVFSRDVAAEFLQFRANRSDSQGAIRLAGALGYLPLALDHAGAYCRRTGIAFETYCTMLTDLIAKAPKGSTYPESIFATFDLAIRKAVESTPEAERLMGLLAYLAPDRVPVDLMGRNIMSEIERGEAIASVVEVSLVTLDRLDDGRLALNIHRLIQQVMRSSLTAKGTAVEVASRAIDLIFKALPQPEYPDRETQSTIIRRLQIFAELLPHALAAIEATRQTVGASGKEQILLWPFAAFLSEQGEYESAQRLFRWKLAYEEANIPHSFQSTSHSEKIDLTTTFFNLAQSLKDSGLLSEAETMSRRGYALLMDYCDDSTYDDMGRPRLIAEQCATHAEILQALGQFKEAKECVEIGLIRLDRAMEDEPGVYCQGQMVGSSFRRFAEIMRAQGRLSEAEQLLRRAVSLGNLYSQEKAVLTALAVTLAQQGRLSEAEELARRVLKERGDWHPEVAMSLDVLAMILIMGQRFEEALPLLQRALGILDASLGRNHHDTKLILDHLGSVQDKLRKVQSSSAEK